MSHRSEWFWYIACAIATLIWKCFLYCYIGVQKQKKPLKQCFFEWFEIVTIDSKISWLVTIFAVWGVGTIYITGTGLNWIWGGRLAGIPVCDPLAGLLGILAEYLIPAAFKWGCKKLPFSISEGS